MLAIYLLGPPQIIRNNAVLTVSRRKSRALLYYLAAHDRPLLRDELLTLLWPDLERAAAQQTLRSSLYALRKELGQALITSDTQLSLASEVFVDLRQFEARLHRANSSIEDLAAALKLYRGDFLANMSLPDCEDYERWAAALRERLRQHALAGFIRLAQHYEQNQDYVAARAVLAQALALNPLQEEVHRIAMRVDYYAADRAGAIRRYEQLRQLLDDELGVPPLEETRALYDAIITDALAVPEHRPARRSIQSGRQAAHMRPRPEQLPFIGRDKELALLQSYAIGQQLVLIEGEAGIGKTRLAEDFLSKFSGLVLGGQGHELEQSLPYQPMIEALRGLLQRPEWADMRRNLRLAPVWQHELGRLLPELHPEHTTPIEMNLPDGNEARLWEAIHQLLIALAEQQPLAVFIDDLHWTDAATLALLGYLLRQSGQAEMCFLATSRAIQPHSPLATLVQTLTRQNRVYRLALSRLDSQATLTLAQHYSPLYAYPLADWLHRNADGNPYILAELLRHAQADGMLLSDGTLNLSSLSQSPVVPGSVYSLIQSRLAHLSDAAHRILHLGVAIGAEFDLTVMKQAAGLDELAVLDSLDELLEQGLIIVLDGLRYRFDHPLTMEVAYLELGEARHRLMHRRVAEALELVYAQNLQDYAGLIASHYAEAQAAECASQYAFLAGQRAAELSAWAEAIAFYQHALAGADIAQRLQISIALGQAYMAAGALAQASDTLRQTLQLAEQRQDVDLAYTSRLLLAQSMIGQARFAEAIEIAQQILAHANPIARISAELIWATALSIEGVDLAGAAEHLQRASTQSDSQPSAEQQAQIEFELGGIAAQQGDLEQALSHYHTALTISEAHPAALQYRVLALNNLAYHHMLNGDDNPAAYARRGLALAEEYGLLHLQPYLFSTLGEIAMQEEAFDLAEQHFHSGLELAERLNIRERIAGITANLGLLAIRRKQPERAIRRLASAQAQADALGTRHLSAVIRLWLAPLLPAEEARQALSEARAIAESGGRRRLLEEIRRVEADWETQDTRQAVS